MAGLTGFPDGLDLGLHSAFDQFKVLPRVEAVAIEADLEDPHVFLFHIDWHHHHGLWRAFRRPT